MRKSGVTQHALYSYRTLEERIADVHPLRKLRVLVDAILANMNHDSRHCIRGASVPPSHLSACCASA